MPVALRSRAIALIGSVILITSIGGATAMLSENPPGPKGVRAGAAMEPCIGVSVTTHMDLRRRIGRSPSGTVFCLQQGVHRLRKAIRPRDGQELIGAAGAVLNGSRRVRRFSKAGRAWVARGQTQQSKPEGECVGAYRGCRYNEVVFYDDQPLRAVSSLRRLRRGSYFMDYDKHRLFIRDRPHGHKVEAAVARQAIAGPANGVTITGLVVEKFATPAQEAAIDGRDGAGWIISGNEVRLNHGIGIEASPQGSVVSNHVHHQGQMGVGAGGGVDIVFEGNEIAYNNTARFDPSWEAGGSKFVETTGLVIRGNHVHHNAGPGLWTDIDNMDTLIEDNVVTDNAGGGILHEISYDAVIRNNLIARNFPGGTWLDGAGISVESSPNVEVYGNTLDSNGDGLAVVQRDRSPGIYGEHISRNVYFHDNVVRMCEGESGAVQNVGDTALFTSRGIRFENNHYLVGTSKTKWWQWLDSARTWSEWQGYGLDAGSIVAQHAC